MTPHQFWSTANPDKMKELTVEAIKASMSRGHCMQPFRLLEEHSSTQARAYCMNCEAYVDINCHPLPNEIEIGGTTVSTNCKSI